MKNINVKVKSSFTNSESIILSLLQAVTGTMKRIGLKGYLWGGLIPDIYSKKFLRTHDDLEFFVLNLYEHTADLIENFQEIGFETEILGNGDLRILRNGFKVQLGAVEIKSDEAFWYHNGKLGYIKFPMKWLNGKEIEFFGVHTYAVKPEFQYTLKTNPQFMNPEWNMREKDVADIKQLKELLHKAKIDVNSLRDLMTAICLGQ